MASNRIGRINEEIQRELSALIPAVKDPRVSGMISVTAVETTPDLRYAKAYISVLDKENGERVLKGTEIRLWLAAPGAGERPEAALHPRAGVPAG